MNPTERFAQFLADEMADRPSDTVKNIRSYIYIHLSRFIASPAADSFFAERRRLAAAFSEKAQDSDLKQAILDKILNLNPAI